jgi:hypothetical protein
MNELYDDNIPLQDCIFPKRGVPNESNLCNPQWIGACCDMTAILMYSPQIINVTPQRQSETVPKSKKDTDDS